MEYFVKHFVPALKDALEENNYPSSDDEKSGWKLLIGIRGRIFTIEDDYHVGQDFINYSSIGSGSPYALGALYASSKAKDPQKILTDALKAAELFTTSVCGPFIFEEI